MSARFDEKLDRYSTPDQCWPWCGALGSGGYGQISTSDGVMVQAHRFAYEREYGAIPDGMVVMHRCDNRLCCRPSHLRLGTQRENIRDAVNKGRMKPGGRPCKSFGLAVVLDLKAGTPEYKRIYQRTRRRELDNARRRLAATLEIKLHKEGDHEE